MPSETFSVPSQLKFKVAWRTKAGTVLRSLLRHRSLRFKLTRKTVAVTYLLRHPLPDRILTFNQEWGALSCNMSSSHSLRHQLPEVRSGVKKHCMEPHLTPQIPSCVKKPYLEQGYWPLLRNIKALLKPEIRSRVKNQSSIRTSWEITVPVAVKTRTCRLKPKTASGVETTPDTWISTLLVPSKA